MSTYDFASMTPHEYRTLHRYTLHPLDQRGCKDCNTLFEGIKANFHVKRHYETGIIAYNTFCRSCQSVRTKQYTEKARKNPEQFIKLKFASYKSRAKEDGLPFDLTAEYLIDLFNKQDGKCFYTGYPIDFELTTEDNKSPHRLTPSLDKLDPELGYVQGNVAWTAYYLNRMKNDLKMQSFLRLCKHITKHTKHLTV